MFNSIPENFFYSPIGIDWNVINAIDPSDLLLSRNESTMQLILTDFLKTPNFDNVPLQIMSKFLSILQIIVDNLYKTKNKLTKKNKKLTKENIALLNKCNKCMKKNAPINLVGHSCPVCYKSFLSPQYLDMHIFTHHSDLSSLWQSLRTPHYNVLSHLNKTSQIKQNDDSINESKLRQTFKTLSEQFINEQEISNERIKQYFNKRLSEVNDKIDLYKYKNGPKGGQLSFSFAKTNTGNGNTENIDEPKADTATIVNNIQSSSPSPSTLNDIVINGNQIVNSNFLEEEEEGEIQMPKNQKNNFSKPKNIFVISDSNKSDPSSGQNEFVIKTTSEYPSSNST